MADNKDLTRRDAIKAAGAATIAGVAASHIQGAPAILKARAATNAVNYGMVGTGSRGTYLLKHLKGIDTGRCVAICDLTDDALNKADQTIGGSPKRYKDYRELLADKNVETVFVTTPLFMHFPVTKDALEAGKHVFCEKSMVFKAEEVHALRALAAARPKQTLQVGLQRRYSAMYQAARQMIEKGMLGDVTYVQAQWHRNPGWKMKKGVPNERMANWRLFREYSGGLVAELASHQIDVADRMLGMTPESVMGLGSHDFLNDGRDILDNVQLIYKYPKGRRLVWTGIPTSSHWAGVGGQRTEMGEMICGTQGTIHITIGDDNNMPIGMWFREPNPPAKVEEAGKKKEAFKAGATMVAAAGSRPLPILLGKDLMTGQESFLEKEMKFARQWLYQKGIMVPLEERNPVDIELESFFNDIKTGGHPRADIEVGLQDSIAVILSNLALDENRTVSFKEIETMGKPGAAAAKTPVKKG
ncbi:Gfo/Idh/MocA family protein [Paludibaculum fermentans]|uniref:Gfo/Idh/MocA family oxidoreductase n=1 Tax=Paludibaculum fermentans TaxID=1473598 RepID=A0A7S7SHC1_PALFE|nr:Gfo/Idh/MocA family oxidoreductase [Paludibaculum fermentans]QOY85747.1 Gfo/Idh/MocA family oxidoreductase [Paludibaculum fermentans]